MSAIASLISQLKGNSVSLPSYVCFFLTIISPGLVRINLAAVIVPRESIPYDRLSLQANEDL